jgi:hypothetical protein
LQASPAADQRSDDDANDHADPYIRKNASDNTKRSSGKSSYDAGVHESHVIATWRG